jgi:GTP-binding protein HflX
MAKRESISLALEHSVTALIGLYTQRALNTTPEHYFQEFVSLVHTLGMPYEFTLFTKLRAIDNNMFLSKGKLEEIHAFCAENKIKQIVFSEILSSVQERNLEKVLDVDILDRERIILEIFKKSAHSSEGKIQVEMAELQFHKTRLIGKGKEFAQQAGVIGVRGPGETYKETIRRHIDEKERQAKKRLVTLERSRDVQRKQRLMQPHPLVCLIGYTNSGKSSILNRITKAHVLAENKLFATLDTTTRELFLTDKKRILMSDTVGFINQLPHSLIAAFKSTLDELSYAHLLLHVIDASNPAWKSQIEVVATTLKDLSVDKPMVYLFNKVDLLTGDQKEAFVQQITQYEPHILIHTMDKDGIQPLIDFLMKYQF